jgi:hypothetical protein
MVTFHDPAIIALDFCAYIFASNPGTVQSDELVCLFTVAVVKLWHTVNGLYMCVSMVPATRV